MKKRIFSCMLCLLLTLLLLSAAAADTNPPQKLGTPPWEVDAEHEDVIDVFNPDKQMQIGENAFEIAAGKRKNLGFTPTESGYYAIYSVGTYDTYGILRDPNLNVYAENDDCGSLAENENFRIVYELTAGTQYVVGVQFYSKTESGTVTVVLEKLTNPCGNYLTWSFDASTGALTISGYGDMWSFDNGMPWAAYTHDIASVSLPEGITKVAAFAFAGCDNLTSVNIPASVTSIGEGAFMGCRRLTPEGISIDPGCTRYYMTDGVMYFHDEGWGIKTYLASNPEKTYTITGNMDAVDDYAFADCDNLVAVTIDDVGLYDINEGTFMDCSSLEYAGLFSVSRIDKKAFWDCTSLRRIVVTTDLELVEANAFVNCNALSHVYYLGTEAERNANLTIESTGNTKLLNATWHYVDDVSTFMCGDYLFWYYNDEMHTLAIEGTGDMWDFEWKASPWFEYNDEMQVAVIDSGVTRIGDYAFMNCDRIVGFTLPQGLKSIGENAFENNHTMTEIDIPASVKSIEDNAFKGCDMLETVTLHEGLETIGDEAFRGCWELNAFHIPASVNDIGAGLFRECYALTAENFTVDPGNTLYRAEDGVLFTYDYEILHTYLLTNPQTEYTVPEDVKRIENYAFADNYHIVSVELPRWLYSIGKGAFTCCEFLAHIELPNNLHVIGEDALSSTAISVVRIPPNVDRIENWTFSWCKNLKYVEIPTTVTKIGKGAFYQEPNALTDVYYLGTETYRSEHLTIQEDNEPLENAAWHYETSLTSFMCGDDLYWEYDSRNRLLGIHGTGDMWDFPYSGSAPWESYRTNVRSILIANSSAGSNVTSIGAYAFDGFTGVTSFSMPSSIRRIGICAFADCTALNTVTLSSNLVEIDTSAFRGCTALSGITLPSTLTRIGSYAFAHCSAIPSVTIPAGVAVIEETAFSGMDSVPAFTVAEGNAAYCAVDGVLFTIDGKTLLQYPGGNTATSYEIPDGVEYVAEDAFAFHKHLVTVDVPNTVTQFAPGAFACCEALQTITLPDSISGVSGEMFTNCPALQTITLPGTVTFVGDAAFYGCTALSDVYFIGTEAQRNAIEFNIDNELLENANWHYLPVAFKTQSVTLSGQIGVTFYMDLSPLTDAEKQASYMTFTISGRGSVDADPVPFDANHMNDSRTYYGFTCRVNAVQMADTITATYHFRDGLTISMTYSVEKYILKFLEYESQFSEKTRVLVRALADYGHYAQLYLADVNGWTLGVGDDQYAPMNTYFTRSYEESAVGSALADYAISVQSGTADITGVTFTTVMDSETSIRLFFKRASGYTGTVTATVDGSPATIKESGSRYYVEIPNIPAHRLNLRHTVVLTTDGGTLTLQLSALSYVKLLFDNRTDAIARNAAAAILNYANAAVALLSNN